MSTQSRNAKRIRVLILDPPEGTRPHTSLAHARRHVAKRIYEWADQDLGERCRQIRRVVAPPPAEFPHSVNLPPPINRKITDSGRDGFLGYPQVYCTQLKYPGLSRMGAGL